MANTRDNNIPAIFGDGANTTIPTVPAQGVAYRNTALTPATLLSGFGFDTLADSADINEILHILYELATEVDRSGILGWSETVDYTTLNGVVRGSDGTFYVSTELSGPDTVDGVRDPVNGTNIPSHWRTLVDFIGGGAGVGTTDLTVARTATQVTVQSSTGSNATIPSASITEAGVISAADQAKLNGLSGGSVATNLITVTSNMAYTRPASVRSLKFTIIGAGGGGGGSNDAGRVSGGGGAGGTSISVISDPSEINFTINIGIGGAGGPNGGNGGQGGFSSVTVNGRVMFGNGGGRGIGITFLGGTVSGGVGGGGSGSDLTIPGQRGASALDFADGLTQLGHGGSPAMLGHGAFAGGISRAGVVGGGGSGTSTTFSIGGRGGDGIVIIEEFF